MNPRAVRCIAAVLAVALTSVTGDCGTLSDETRPDDTLAGSRAPGELSVVAKPRAGPNPEVSEAELRDSLKWILLDVRIERVRAEWRRLVADPHFHPFRAESPARPYRLMLASSRDSALQEITTGYRAWCGSEARPGACITLPLDRGALNESDVYQVAFDFAMGARWDGFIKELKGMIDPSALRMVILTGLVVMMACIAIPELLSKIPVAIVTAVLTAYLGAQAVYNLVFGWIRMVREVDTAVTFAQVRAAGERYGELVGAETARILVLIAMAAISEGGVVAKLMRLPQAAQASAAMAEDTGGVGLEAIPKVKQAQVLQGGVTIAVEGAAQGAVTVAMAPRGGAPNVKTTLPLKPPSKPVDIKLKYREDWTEQQRADARAKIKRLNEAEDKKVVKSPKRVNQNASAFFRRHGYDVPPGCDVDHCVDLQLNGKDTLENMLPLNSSVNRSLGSLIHHAIKDLPEGTPIGRITIE